jgi:hypothetical protein
MMITTGKLYQIISYALAGVLSLSKHLHPPLSYSEFLKRNDDALLIHVVDGGKHQPRRVTLFLLNTCNSGSFSQFNL